MRRRMNLNGDSLELLLDTICNTFGGVLFIAILLVVLLQLAPAVTESEPVEASASAARSLAASRQQRSELQLALQHQQELLTQLVSPQLQNSLAEMATLQNQVGDAQQQVTELEAANARTVAQLAKDAEEAATLASQVETARQQVAALRTQLNADRDSHTEQIQLPTEHLEFGKGEVGLILRYGRLYVWHRWSPTGERLGLNTEEFVVIEDSSKGLVVRPKPGGGLPIDRRDSTREQIEQRLKQFRPTQKVLALVVRPDSFAEYRVVREVAARLGFEYRLMPCDNDSPVSDRGGRGGFVQ